MTKKVRVKSFAATAHENVQKLQLRSYFVFLDFKSISIGDLINLLFKL